MIKIYGMPSCPYCEYVQKQIVGRENESDRRRRDPCICV